MTKRKRDEELPAEEDEVEAKEDEVKEKFIVNVKSHVKCDICRYKIKDTLENPAPPVEFADLRVELPNSVNAVVIKEFSVCKLRTDFEKRFGMEVEVNIDETNCDIGDSYLDAVVEKDFRYFRDSFNSRVAASCKGKWGSLYQSTYSSVFKTFYEDVGGESHSTSFLVHNDDNSSLLLTAGHNVKGSAKVNLIGCDFKTGHASILFCSSTMDFAILKVDSDLCVGFKPLVCDCGELSFGEDVFAISTPFMQMATLDNVRGNKEFHGALDTIWYPMCIGKVAHPGAVGMDEANEYGELININMRGLLEGASGAPIMNSKGHVIGVYVASRLGDTKTEDIHMALKLNLIRDNLVSLFKVPNEFRQKPLGDILHHIDVVMSSKDKSTLA